MPRVPLVPPCHLPQKPRGLNEQKMTHSHNCVQCAKNAQKSPNTLWQVRSHISVQQLVCLPVWQCLHRHEILFGLKWGYVLGPMVMKLARTPGLPIQLIPQTRDNRRPRALRVYWLFCRRTVWKRSFRPPNR